MAEQIQVLSEKDRVRKRISVWLGSNSHLAVIHTIKELVGNAVDIISNGNGDTIEITLIDEKTICVKDNCKGLPVEGMGQKEVEGVGVVDIPNYQLLTAHLFAGTKYENGINGNEDYTVGVNGVFLTVLSRASEFAEYEVARPNGKVYSFSYYKGEEKQPLTVIGKSDKTYTKITYKLDDEIFEDNYFTFDELCEIAQQQASLINGKIIVNNLKQNVTKEYHYDNGIIDLLKEITHGRKVLHDAINISNQYEYFVEKIGATDKMIIDMVMQYTNDDMGGLEIEFLNGSNLIYHGTIYDGAINGLRNSFHKFIKNNNLYNRSEKAITKDDIEVGLNYIINFKSFFPIYQNQTKFATDVTYYQEFMQKCIEQYFEVFSIENKGMMQILSNRILINMRSRVNAENTRLNVRKKLEGSVSVINKVDGFVDCRSKDNKRAELYIVEGKSALGSVVQGRSSEFQAVIPIRGKIMNCLKKDYTAIFKSDIIVDLLKVLGCGVEVKGKHKDLNNFDLDKLRWDKIIICTDADVDGMQIRTLLLTMFYRLTPTLLDKGKIYIAESPLFEIIDSKDKSYFAYSDSERDIIVQKINGKCKIQRSKGLGENTPEFMSLTTMNPKTRKLIKVLPDEVLAMQDKFDLLLGDNLQGRKDYISEYGYQYMDFTELE